MSNNLNLTIIQPLPAKLLPNNQVLLTRKLLEAVVQLRSFWSGSVTVFMEEKDEGNDNIDQKVFNLNELPFKLELLPFHTITPAKLQEHQTSLVLAALEYRQNHISKVCQSAGIPCVYVSEYTLKTRQQIVAVNTPNPLLRLRRNFWEQNQELKQQKAIRIAEGLQCNGTPTYEVYRAINRDPMLFFDTRITEDMLATHEDIERRTHNRSQDMPLRLLFSGRLIKMKGADHLLEVARELKRLGIQFELYISGSGVLEEIMQRTIAEHQLGDSVKMMGVPDFKTEFFPFVKANIDLFVCCHRQGDPSCTYVETMSCGVPIIGYDNEAFLGIVEQSKTGWVVEMDRPKLMAKKIAELSCDRANLREMSLNSLTFARKHTFEKTFAARVEHLKRIAGEPGQ